ncbi:MAG: PhoU domain-containing protein [Planctomycetota bacterium]
MISFDQKLARLKDDLVTQGTRVRDMVRRSVESYFEQNVELADSVVGDDRVIDRVDVEIERASIPLLGMGVTDEYQIRSVLTIVKINNELERIADCAVDMAEIVQKDDVSGERPPAAFRVMANSVIAMVRDANLALARLDTGLAKQVLECDDAVEMFMQKIGLDVEEKVASGDLSVRFVFRLSAVTKALEQIADHCTNMCEQVIYLETGKIVRHGAEGWSMPAAPDLT